MKRNYDMLPKGLRVLRYALVNFSQFYIEFVYVQKWVI